MTANELFNDLHFQKDATRDHIFEIIDQAKLENNIEVIYRLGKVLENNPTAKTFDLTIVKHAAGGLNAPRHMGDYKIALDDCGRLRPGFRFLKGRVVLVEPKLKKKVAKKTVAVPPKPKAVVVVKKPIVKKQIKAAPKRTPKVISKPKVATNFGKKRKYVAKPKAVAVKKVVAEKKVGAKKATDVFVLPINKIALDTKRFQNRDGLNQQKLNAIVKNYDETQLDPVIVWIDPKDKKTYLLAGHHRLEATKIVGKKTISVKYKKGTEADAIKFAKVESNSNRSLETPSERAKIYREMRLKGVSKTKINEIAKETEPRANYVIALSYLEPKGIVLQTLNALAAGDTQNQKIIETIAEWIGDAKSSNEFTVAHEREMFDFLQDKDASKRITTKAEFKQKIAAIAGGFDFDINQPLNLKRFKYSTEGEKMYFEETKALTKLLNIAIENKASLKDRIANPNNVDFIKPTDKDYNSILKALDTAINKYTDEIASYQKQIIALTRKKGSYTTAGANQVGLFGAKNQIIKCGCGWKWNKKDGGAKPYVCHKCGADTSKKKVVPLKSPVLNSSSLASRLANKNGTTANYYIIDDADIKAFLGDVEIKNKESVAITITGSQGSMKTRLCFQLMNAFAQNYKVGHASIEEHPESNLYFDKVNQYIKGDKALNNISAPEISNIADVHQLCRDNDVIVIDSFSKLQELEKGIELDKDFRKAYNGKLFIIIYQQTSDGKMRGGAKSQFDGDIIGFVKKEDDYRNNYAYWDKNRYHSGNLETLKFNIYSGTLNQQQNSTVATEQFAFSAV